MGKKFSRRDSWDSLFRSERYFLKKIDGRYKTILDVGCALGGLASVFDKLVSGVQYTGVDISQAMVDRASEQYGQHEFVRVNILEFDVDKTYDLVFSTGVCQHEPKFHEVIKKLTALSHSYVLFDCKLVSGVPSVIDIAKSYCDYADRLYYILVNIVDLLDFLRGLPDVKSINIFGYFAPPVGSAILPESVDPDKVCACHVLLEKGLGAASPELHVDLPGEIVQAIDPCLLLQ